MLCYLIKSTAGAIVVHFRDHKGIERKKIHQEIYLIIKFTNRSYSKQSFFNATKNYENVLFEN